MECRCHGTMGMFINLRNRHKLWICDLCKGVRVFRPDVVPTPRIIDPNFELFVRRYQSAHGEIGRRERLKIS